MADIAMAPYLNRLAALSMDGLWQRDRLRRVERWFERISERSTFTSAITDWIPVELGEEMRANGERSWPEIRAILGL